jgi:hypothetical protein
MDLAELWTLDVTSPRSLRRLCSYCAYRTVAVFPALVRRWFSEDCERSLSAGIAKFVEDHVAARIMQREIDLVRRGRRMMRRMMMR